MKLYKLLDCIKASQLIEVYRVNDVCGEMLVFRGLLCDFYSFPKSKVIYGKYHLTELTAVEPLYDEDLDAEVLFITCK